jgi:hypothetical protein
MLITNLVHVIWELFYSAPLLQELLKKGTTTSDGDSVGKVQIMRQASERRLTDRAREPEASEKKEGTS